MKFLSLTLGFCPVYVTLFAQPSASRTPEHTPTIEEIQTIRKILELSPEQLARIRSAIEKIERLPPESRREFAAKLESFETASPEERHILMKELRDRGGFGARVLEHHFKTLKPEDAKVERERINKMTPEKRMEYIRFLAEHYRPELAKERNKTGESKDSSMKRRKPLEGEITSPAQ